MKKYSYSLALKDIEFSEGRKLQGGLQGFDPDNKVITGIGYILIDQKTFDGLLKLKNALGDKSRTVYVSFNSSVSPLAGSEATMDSINAHGRYYSAAQLAGELIKAGATQIGGSPGDAISARISSLEQLENVLEKLSLNHNAEVSCSKIGR